MPPNSQRLIASCFAVLFYLAVCSCGNGSNATDAALPPKGASSDWEAEVDFDGVTDPYLGFAQSIGDRIVLVSKPELVLYTADGDELARTPWPADFETGSAAAALSLLNDQVAVAFRAADGRGILVASYSATDLSEQRLGQVSGIAIGAVTMAAVGDRPFVIYREVLAQPRLLIYDAADPTPSPAEVSTVTSYGIGPAGLSVQPDELLVCATRAAGGGGVVAELLRINTQTAAVSPEPLSASDNATSDGCSLVATPAGPVAIWLESSTEGLVIASALLTADGTSVVRGPTVGPLHEGGSRIRAVYDGTSVIQATVTDDAIYLHRFDPQTGAAQRACKVSFAPAHYYIGGGASVTVSNEQVAVGFVTNDEVDFPRMSLRRLRQLR